MQAARSPANRALVEVTLDALAADLTVPHARPLVDLDRDDYADLEVGEVTVPFLRERLGTDLIVPRPRVRGRQRYWSPPRVAAAVWAVAIGFCLGAGVALLLI